MATYAYTFTSGDTVTPTKLNSARTVSEIVNADISASAAIAATKLASDSITNTQIKSDAAIAGTKIAPDFGSQNVVTSGEIKVSSDAAASAVVGRSSTDSSSPSLLLQKSRGTQAAKTIVSAGDECGSVGFAGYDGSQFINAAAIGAQVDGTPGANDMPGRLVFYTTADGGSTHTERMRIDSSGNVGIGTTNPSSLLTVDGTASATTFKTGTLSSVANAGTAEGVLMLSNSIQASRDQNICGSFRRTTSNGVVFQFYRDTTTVGAISVTTTATAYNTSSDYRLKENATPLIGGLSTIDQLQPCEFTWKADGSIGRGFIAHELQAVVPEAVTGEKDAVDAEGNPEYQGVDAAKLVPYLVSAVKELKTRVEALEAA